ncbi:MAG: oligopeptide/dipeptide ABC transporter ATP-binding protein [Erythrobacter sp.]
MLYPDPRRKLSRFLLSGEIPSPIDLPTGCHLHQRCPWSEPRCAAAVPPIERPRPGREVICHRAEEMRLAADVA